MFNAESIQNRLREKPFIPFRLVMSSGESYDVTQPDLVMVGPRFLIIGTPYSKNPTMFEAVNRVSLLHVTDLQDRPAAAPPPTNGSQG